MSSVNQPFIDKRSVAAVQIFNEILAIHPQHLRVMPTDGAYFADHVTVWMPTEDHSRLGELQIDTLDIRDKHGDATIGQEDVIVKISTDLICGSIKVTE